MAGANLLQVTLVLACVHNSYCIRNCNIGKSSTNSSIILNSLKWFLLLPLRNIPRPDNKNKMKNL